MGENYVSSLNAHKKLKQNAKKIHTPFALLYPIAALPPIRICLYTNHYYVPICFAFCIHWHEFPIKNFRFLSLFQELQDLGRDPPAQCSAGPVGDDRKCFSSNFTFIFPYQSQRQTFIKRTMCPKPAQNAHHFTVYWAWWQWKQLKSNYVEPTRHCRFWNELQFRRKRIL